MSFRLLLPLKIPRLTDTFSLAWVCNLLWKFHLKNTTAHHFKRKTCVFISLKFQSVYQKWSDFSFWQACHSGEDVTRNSFLALCTCPFVGSTFKELQDPWIAKTPLLVSFLSDSHSTTWSWRGRFPFAASFQSDFSFTSLPSTSHQWQFYSKIPC